MIGGVIAITDKIQKNDKNTNDSKNKNLGKNTHTIGAPVQKIPKSQPIQSEFNIGEIERALYAKIVQKCGNRSHWEDWAKDIAEIAKTHITRITSIVNNPSNEKEASAFQAFADELRDDLNDSITNPEVIEMLAQHLITKPVFDALFKEYSFAKNNPVSQAMQNVLEMLHEHRLEKEADTLEKFYASVQMRAEGIDNAEGKQKIVIELYDKFFRNAFPQMTERLGIVYTPVAVVDFIIHSVNDVLQAEFGQTLGSQGVHIIDPFTGTGTFITRMLQSGLISKAQLPYKYKNEIHANEIILLAYYIAAINIEAVYHNLVGGDFQPFEGICLTDTFQLYEKDDLISELLVDNSARRVRQKKLDIRVIIGNPPYSAGQKSQNDSNQNVSYLSLDKSIEETYAKHSKATLKQKIYDSYIRAIRWGSDRLGESGVLAYVSNAGWLDGNAMDGMRKCLVDEYSSIFVFHLRGNQRTSGELSRKEGGKIFGSGSRAPIAITLFVKNPKAKEQGKIYFHDIGDYLNQDEKIAIISNFKSLAGIAELAGWQTITPDKHHDWLNQRDDSFEEFIEIGNKKNKRAESIFETYTLGISTNRDSWCYNFSKTNLSENMERMIDFYNSEVDRFSAVKNIPVKTFINTDSKKISWPSSLVPKVEKEIKGQFNAEKIIQGIYRPFQKQWLYYDRLFNHRVGLMPQIFPNAEVENRVIQVSGVGARSGFSALMTDTIPDYHTLDTGQNFPLKLYEKKQAYDNEDFLAENEMEGGYSVKDGITDDGLAHFRKSYPKETISKEAIFYYIYGLLHSEDYRRQYADNLSKQLPRIPAVKKASDFWSFVKAGRKLGELHIGYENAEPYPVTIEGHPKTAADYYVKKMKFGKAGKEKDKSTVIYNDHLTIKKIPLAAYDYIVNGKPALEWVMDRQCVKTDKASGIVNDANRYATETVRDPTYPLTLFQRLIRVSLETLKIVESLPTIEFYKK